MPNVQPQPVHTPYEDLAFIRRGLEDLEFYFEDGVDSGGSMTAETVDARNGAREAVDVIAQVVEGEYGVPEECNFLEIVNASINSLPGNDNRRERVARYIQSARNNGKRLIET